MARKCPTGPRARHHPGLARPCRGDVSVSISLKNRWATEAHRRPLFLRPGRFGATLEVIVGGSECQIRLGHSATAHMSGPKNGSIGRSLNTSVPLQWRRIDSCFRATCGTKVSPVSEQPRSRPAHRHATTRTPYFLCGGHRSNTHGGLTSVGIWKGVVINRSGRSKSVWRPLPICADDEAVHRLSVIRAG